jgi:hypothetical protein
MAITELKKTAADTGYAVVGVTDLAVERVRKAQARAAAARVELDVKKVSDKVQQAPTLAAATAREAAVKAEVAYGELSARGKQLVQRLRTQRATQDLLEQGKLAVARTRAAVTTARRGAEDVAEVADKAAEETSTTARKRTQATKAATKSAAKASAATAEAAGEATSAGAEKVGD